MCKAACLVKAKRIYKDSENLFSQDGDAVPPGNKVDKEIAPSMKKG